MMEIGDGGKKRRGACEVVVKRAMDASLGADDVAQARIAGKSSLELDEAESWQKRRAA